MSRQFGGLDWMGVLGAAIDARLERRAFGGMSCEREETILLLITSHT